MNHSELPPGLRMGQALRGLLVCIAYFFGTMLGKALIFPTSYVSIVWPPNVLLLVALLLSPRQAGVVSPLPFPSGHTIGQATDFAVPVCELQKSLQTP